MPSPPFVNCTGSTKKAGSEEKPQSGRSSPTDSRSSTPPSERPPKNNKTPLKKDRGKPKSAAYLALEEEIEKATLTLENAGLEDQQNQKSLSEDEHDRKMAQLGEEQERLKQRTDDLRQYCVSREKL